MRKIPLLVVCLFYCVVPSANAQLTALQAREVEWKNYSLPQTNFTRQTNADKEIVFRVPADWKQESTELLLFTGPHSSQIKVFIDKVPDGFPLPDYVGSILRVVRSVPGVEAPLTRKTQLQDLEGREIVFESPNPEGELTRSVSWITINGPLAVAFNLQTPAAHAAEVEPFFKAVVQSVIFLPREHSTFDSLRSSTLKSPAPGPIHVIENIVTSFDEAVVDRESIIAQLTPLFSSQPDVAVDLLVDRRPFVRAAAVQALVRSNNSTLTPFLWELVDDKEPLVAEAAARSVASAPDVIAKTIKHSMYGHSIQTMGRIWPFMAKEKKIELLQMAFSKTATRTTNPPAALGPRAKGDVTVVVSELSPVKPGTPVPEVTVAFSNDPNVQINALTLLRDVPVVDFKLPFEKITASNHEPLIAVALQVANDRGESLPVDGLFKLVASSDKRVSKLAVQSLALSAGAADVPRLETLISKDSASAKKALDDELKLTIRKIRFRHELSAAKSATESREIINKALSDSSLANFAWRYHCEATVSGCGPVDTQTALKRDFTVKPFGENIFPAKVLLYTAIPKPGEAVQKFYQTLHGLQMDSPRAQSNLALVLGSFRQVVAGELSAPADASTLIEYTGIDPNAPIALAAWTPDKTPHSPLIGQRRAIVLRVKDRGRFERAVERFQNSSGSFTNLVDYLAGGTRSIAALPALLPLTAQAVLAQDPAKSKSSPRSPYSFTQDTEWNGLRIRTIEHGWLDSDWQMQRSITQMVFIGDAVILAPDLATIRELLVNANNEVGLAANAEFRKTIEQRGEVVYFSDFNTVMAEVADAGKKSDYKINESGALTIANASWENVHHLVFEESDWAKPLLPFQPKELLAPRELLPASTVAYYFMNVDLPQFWTSKLRKSFLPDLENSKLWLLEFKQEVLPELGPECGAVLLDPPDLNDFNNVTWAAFCKLKSNKLTDALNAGKLFSGVGPAKEFAEVKVDADSYFVGVRGGFLVVSNRAKGLAAFDGKSNLAATRDYSRAVEKVPGGVVAFGGYNLEAAVTAASKPGTDGLQGQIANLIFSVANAFHSQNFYATATAGIIEARSSVAMDREGRYSISDLSFLPRGANITLAIVDAGGIPITDQKRLSRLVMRVRAKAPGPIENIKDDIKTAGQTVEQTSATELVLTINARRSDTEESVELPVKNAELEPYLKATPEFAADNPQVQNQAREIAGDDRDAWSVARKLADWTHENLEWKHVANADVGQTLASREADCSEFSALFVAMARSLGLPARIVSGLAYSGSSFGGHAWVEVWAGRWIELDPTWGTHFVDATHIRNTSSSLVTSAALNLIEIEVLEAKRTVADFQKSPRALAEHLIKAIPAGHERDVEAAIDLATLTDEFMGAEAWSKMTDQEREQMSLAYRRLLYEIIFGYGPDKVSPTPQKMRLLHLEEKGETAEATCLLESDDLLMKLRLVRRNDAWYLVEIVQSDTHLHTSSETLRPTITTIDRARAGQKAARAAQSDLSRVLILIQTDAAKALSVADNALKTNPADEGLRLLKTHCLLSLEKRDDALKLLRELSGEGFAPAIYKLATELNDSEDEQENKEAIALYERYTLLEPHDSRAFRELATAYDNVGEPGKAEAAYRKVIAINPADSSGHLNLIHFLILRDRIGEVRPLILAAEKAADDEPDIFGSAMENLTYTENLTYGDKFAASEPLRMKTSARANLALGEIYLENGRYARALQLFSKAAQLDKESATPHILLATVHRKQFRWTAALNAAQQAIALEPDAGQAHYQRACALARLRRIKEAMAALEKAVELDGAIAFWIDNEDDLKTLASLPAFKKLLPKRDEK
ncbi:MAG TPA: transglutaminase domain-containing protein [Pyrinomonadaceae bacterium]|nr:transglutaminase domain-containing protein [Pyrinomonadaceae bacterium]